MSQLQAIPCAHLEGEACALGRHFPRDCHGCAAYQPLLTETDRVRCEVWTRVMGYHRPTSAFNAGKQAEHRERKHFRERPDIQFAEGAGHD
jgi:hypothetical protein